MLPRKPRINLVNRVFGDWTVIDYAGPPQSRWNCRCVCGKVKPVSGANLRGGLTTGCGCRVGEKTSHVHWKHGHSSSRNRSLTYSTWANMLSRCRNRNHPDYKTYGGSGITVCKEWTESFVRFLEDVGERPSREYTLDRYPDPKAGYKPGNVRWATAIEQANNKPGTNRILTAFGKSQTIAEWSRSSGLSYTLIFMRVTKQKWSVERAVTEKPTRGRRKKSRSASTTPEVGHSTDPFGPTVLPNSGPPSTDAS